MKLQVPDQLSIPYWLADQPQEGMYTVFDQQMRGLPCRSTSYDLSKSICRYQVHQFHLLIPVVYKTVDPAKGEIYRPISITPPVTVEFDEPVLVFSKGHERTINVTLTAIQDSINGSLRLVIPSNRLECYT